MKFNIQIFLFIVFFSVSCSQNGDKSTQLVMAEKMLFQNPDSTIQLLNQLEISEQLSSFDKEKICLLKTHALYRTYKTEKADTFFLKSLQFFQINKFKKEEGICYYLLGCFDIIANESDSAIFHLKKAEIYLKSTEEHSVKGLIFFNIGDLYLNKQEYQTALTYFVKAKSEFELLRDINHLAYIYSRIANVYNLLNSPKTNTLKYIENSIKYAELSKDTLILQYNLLCKAEYLINLNNPKAKQILLNLYHSNYINNRMYLLLSDLYIKEKNPDSTNYFFEKINSNFKNKTDRLNYLIILSKINKHKSDYKSALNNIEDVYLLRDSIYLEMTRNKTRMIDRKLDVRNLEYQNLLLTSSRKNILIYLSFSILLLVTIIVLIYVQNVKRKHKEQETFHQQELITKEIQFIKEVNEQKKILLQEKLSNLIRLTVKLKELNETKKGKMNLETFKLEILNQFNLTENEWDSYINETDLIFDKKISQLRIEYPRLTKADFIVITLIWNQIDITDSCLILNVEKDTIYKRRLKIKERLNLSEKTSIEKWLFDYIEQA